MKKIVSIPEKNVDKFKTQMDKLVKLSKKLGGGNVQYKLLNEEIREHKKDDTTYYIKYFNFEISGDTPKLNDDYKLVAVMERQNKLNLIKHIDKDIELPEDLKYRKNYCEHCNSNRARKILFLLQEVKTGKFVQVGKTCVKDFLGWHKSPKQIADWHSYLGEIDELENIEEHDFSSGASGMTLYVSSLEVIAVSAYFTDKEGYVRTMEATTERPSTAKKAVDAILGDYFVQTKVKEKGYLEVAQKVVDWVMNQKATSDYILNLQTLIEEEYIDARKAGFLASAYFSYLRAMDREKEEVARKQSQYVGEVGKRQNFELVFDRETSYETDFGTKYIYIFNDSDGNVLIWKTTKCIDFEKGQKVTLKATIQKHDEYRGVKQTILTRCKVM